MIMCYHYQIVETERRNTKQRAAICKAFERAGRPLSPQEVLKSAKGEVKELGIATVYRNIKGLLEEGWLSAVAMPGAATIYERAGKAHHHHFHCDRCSRVFELRGCVVSINGLAGPRFSVNRHELVLYGVCADCKRLPRA